MTATGSPARMSEAQLQQAVIECAQTLGWRVAHFRPAKTAKGWRTPVEADGAGFPDLILIRNGHLIAAELKSNSGAVSPEQQAWLDGFLAVSIGVNRVQVYVWRPAQWLNGDIETVLR